jgi:hypothetical protein
MTSTAQGIVLSVTSVLPSELCSTNTGQQLRIPVCHIRMLPLMLPYFVCRCRCLGCVVL